MSVNVGQDGLPPYLKASDAGKALGVSPKTVGRWVKLHEQSRGQMFPQLTGAYTRTLGRHLRIRSDRLDSFRALAGTEQTS